MPPSPQNATRIVVNFTYSFAELASTRRVELIELDATYIPSTYRRDVMTQCGSKCPIRGVRVRVFELDRHKNTA
jgi:hypothetical protein